MAFPLAAAALVSAGTSLAGDALGYYSQQRANQSNEWNVAQTNEMNYRMFNEANEFNERMYNQYQSPEALRRQYEAAGLNPNLMMDGSRAGTPSSSVSPPNMQAAQVQPYSFDGLKSFGQNMLAIAQAENIQADTDAQRMRNLYVVEQELADLENKRSSKSMTDSQRSSINEDIQLKQIERDYLRESNQWSIENQKADLQLKYEQKTFQTLQNQYQRMVNDVFPQLTAAQLNQLRSTTAKAYADANLSNKMSDHEVEKKALTITQNQCEVLRKNGIKVNQHDVHRINQANYRYINTLRQKVHHSDNWVNNWSPLVSGAGSVAGAAILK